MGTRCKHGMLYEQCGFCNRPAVVVGHAVVAPPPKTPRKRERLEPLGAIRTLEQFKSHMAEVAKDLVADGHDVVECAGDIADCMVYDDDVMRYVRRNFSWIRTRLELREFLADYLVG